MKSEIYKQMIDCLMMSADSIYIFFCLVTSADTIYIFLSGDISPGAQKYTLTLVKICKI